MPRLDELHQVLQQEHERQSKQFRTQCISAAAAVEAFMQLLQALAEQIADPKQHSRAVAALQRTSNQSSL
jgi:uroporphyrinogen-III synthase